MLRGSFPIGGYERRRRDANDELNYYYAMSLHIQMSDDALRKLKRDALLNKLISFGVCSGLILLFGGILYFTVMIIQGEVPTEFISYVPPSEDGPPTNTPVAKELTSRSVNTNPTVTPSVIVAQNAVGAVASPVSVDTTGDISFDQMDISMDMDLGEGLGETGGGFGSSTAGGSSLEGTFYDLKLTRNGVRSGVAKEQDVLDEDQNPKKGPDGRTIRKLVVDQQAYGREAQKFFKGWNEAALSAFYRSPQKLYASSFYVPWSKDFYGPIAYQCDDVCKPGGWLVVYRGRVRAPKTGKFRFVGTGDDYIGVRFNNKVVLEAGYRIPSLYDENDLRAWWVGGLGDRERYWKNVKSGKLKGFEEYENITFVHELKVWNTQLGLTGGKVFEVKEGQEYPIQIVICEIPGGGFGLMLFIEDLTDGKKVKPGQKFDLFRTNLEIPDRKKLFELMSHAKNKKGEIKNCLFSNNPDDLVAPPFNEDSPVWVAVP